MKNILYAMIAMLLLGISLVSANGIDCGTNPSAVTGTVYDQSHATVPEAHVTVQCNGEEATADTNSEGDYYVCFNAAECTYGDALYAEATKADVGSGYNDTETMCAENVCFIPIGLVDITIPEFGLIAGAVALVGALGIFLYRRK